MALRGLLHSVSTIVFGYSKDGNVQYSQTLRYPDGGRKRSKDPNEGLIQSEETCKGNCRTAGFQMPLHYPRYKKADYDNMEERKVDMLLTEYGLSFKGTLEEKRAFAIGTFLWPDQI